MSKMHEQDDIEILKDRLHFVIESAKHRVKFQQITMTPTMAEKLLKLLEKE